MEFGRGWTEYEKNKKEIEESSVTIWDFFLMPDSSRTIRFLTKEPALFYRHVIKVADKFKSFYCTNDNTCPLCKQGEKKMYSGSFLIYEKPSTSIKNEPIKGSVKLYTIGKAILDALKKFPENAEISDLTEIDIRVSRTGSGQSTSYQFFPKSSKVNEEDMKIIKNYTGIDYEDTKEDDYYKFLTSYIEKKAESQFSSSILEKKVKKEEFDEEVLVSDDESEDSVPF